MPASADGRFAPSPTGDLHLGNLRTALVAWLMARSRGGRFVVRIEDLDRGRSRREHEHRQLADLAAIGLDWDGDVVRQSDRDPAYAAALATLDERDLLYPCWCTRAEIREAPSAPHGELPEGAYPGTCATLDSAGRRARAIATGRTPAWRVRADGARTTATDVLSGPIAGVVDDFVVRRGDGTHAYNLAVVVDDADQDVDEVVRGEDLRSSAPRQAWLAAVLGLPVPVYAHVPLVLGPTGRRLAKRDGPVTLADRLALGEDPAAVRERLAASLGLAPAGGPDHSWGVDHPRGPDPPRRVDHPRGPDPPRGPHHPQEPDHPHPPPSPAELVAAFDPAQLVGRGPTPYAMMVA